ncbi:hypothetical protein B0H13DRAFT_1913361 [Mycena leptocephala]|nr:hypothetical protein B0H13DRAFT_1913361 [Mycena leptocephala]
MATDAGTGSKHTPADREYLDSLSARQLMDFRDYLFSPTFIARNASKFLDHGWVDVAPLREYLGQPQTSESPDASFTISDPVRVKIEASVASVAPVTPLVKAEALAIRFSQASANIKMRTLHESGREVLELLSDSEPDIDELDSDLEVIHELQRVSRSSSAIPPADARDIDSEVHASGAASGLPSDDESEIEDDHGLLESDTVWLDDGISRVRIGRFRPTQKVSVERMEYRKGPACIYPVHRVRTGIVVDLSDEKYHLRDPATKALYTLNTIIMNADNDSWEWAGGGTRGGANVTFAPDEMPVPCRRVRYECKGAHACDRLDVALRTAVRFELDDPAPRNAIIVAQQETRRREGNTPEERAALFLNLIRNAKCLAVDSNGNKCRGGPILKPKPQGHRTHSISDNVDENLVANGLAGLSLTGDLTKDTPPCSGIIHPHTGLRKNIAVIFTNSVSCRAKFYYSCDATRAIYVPKDSSVRKVLIIHNETGHNHPMPTLSKVSFGLKDTYRQCVEAHGVLLFPKSTTRSYFSNIEVDVAPSTKMQLNGKTPSAHAAPLHNKRVKQDVIHAIKLDKYPDGLDVNGKLRPPSIISHMLMFDSYPADISCGNLQTAARATRKGENIIITFVPYLLMLLDDPGVTSFDGDTTFKGVEGKLNEWEVTVFAKVVQRAASCVRAYITGASADFFEAFFDELQRVKLNVTGKPLPFKITVPGGNLLVTNVDMDAAQVLGLCRSVMKYNNPVYSGIPNDTPPQKFAPRFIKICWRHGKDRLMDFTYIDSKESLDEFSSFVYGLKIKKISDWWRHKEMHEWIIPCIVRSQSLIPAEVWDATPSTTNTNEAQHHWTNSLAGMKLTLVEALESSQRQSAIARKSRESHAAAELKVVNGASGRKKRKKSADETLLSASSSGRVKTSRGRAGPSIPAHAIQSDIPSSSTGLPITVAQLVPDYLLNDFDFNSMMHRLVGADVDADTSSSSHGHASAELFSFNPTFDPTSFGFSANLDTLMPFSTPPDDPLQDFMNSYGFSGGFFDTGTFTTDFGPFTSTGLSDGPLPLLPPPPPNSPPPPSLAVDQRSEAGPSAPRLRRPRQEVDQANIVHSTRTRAPTKRFADGDLSPRPSKKAKGKQRTHFLI